MLSPSAQRFLERTDELPLEDRARDDMTASNRIRNKSLRTPTSEMKPFYQLVVVGSGYGGSVIAARLAKSRSLCLLEQGREIQPADFPASWCEATHQIQVETEAGLIGDSRNLYRFHVSPGIAVVTGCGLGGGSLINAGVAIRPHRAVWENPAWPAAISQDPTHLAPFYKRAEDMLEPRSAEGLPGAPERMRALRRRTRVPNWGPVDVNISTRPDGNQDLPWRNSENRLQSGCNGCGDCVTGCRRGAKNTLDMNYLASAKREGAEIFTEVGVERIEPTSSGWAVIYRDLASNGDTVRDEHSVLADTVVLAAGTLGSTSILLKSRQPRQLRLSDCLGYGFSGNGDFLGFDYRWRHPLTGRPFEGRPAPRARVGPTITALLDQSQAGGPFVEDCVLPQALWHGVAAELALQALPTALRGTRFSARRSLDTALGLLLHSTRSLRHTLPFLVMGVDDAGGVIRVKSDRTTIEWPNVGYRPYYQTTREQLEHLSRGDFLPGPTFLSFLHDTITTVHPLGGCPMADTAAAGVVNHKGQVFKGNTGDETYHGLYVCDGSIIPCPLGVNPLMTITALAERIADNMGGGGIDGRP